MTQWISGSLSLRGLFWGEGACLILGILCQFALKKDLYSKVDRWISRRFMLLLGSFCLFYFALATAAKYSQLKTGGLNGQDFWLFVDLLEQGKKGAFFLTRFAPQSLGWEQHGIIHPMLTWALGIPFAAVIGSTWTALMFGPACFALTAFCIGLIARRTRGGFSALLLAQAFLASSQVGKVLMYEVHPEAMYPLLTLLGLELAGFSSSPQKYKSRALLISTVLLWTWIKEDSFLVIGPWCLLAVVKSFQTKENWQKTIPFVGSFLFAFLFQIYAVRQWSGGGWGPSIWEGQPVNTQVRLNFFGEHTWTGVQDMAAISQSLLHQNGGFFGVGVKFFRFICSKPFLSLLVIAPFLALNGIFWGSLFPLAFVYSFLEGPNHLWNYYSAPFLGVFWFWVIRSRPHFRYEVWVFLVTSFLSGSSAQIFFPSEEARETQRLVRAFLPCLEGQGIVQGHLVSEVPLEKIWTDRIPKNETEWSRVQFVLISPQVNRFGMSREESHQLAEDLSLNQKWVELDPQCKPSKNLNLAVRLFKKI